MRIVITEFDRINNLRQKNIDNLEKPIQENKAKNRRGGS